MQRKSEALISTARGLRWVPNLRFKTFNMSAGRLAEWLLCQRGPHTDSLN